MALMRGKEKDLRSRFWVLAAIIFSRMSYDLSPWRRLVYFVAGIPPAEERLDETGRK